MKRTRQGKPKSHSMKVDRNGYVRCRVCGCTEIEPCNPPCEWVDADLCSTCNYVVREIREWAHEAHRASWAALRREVEAQEAFAAQHASDKARTKGGGR
jgi:hypothetical protein